MIRAVLWDFGGVIVSSPFTAFERFETEQGLPVGFIRSVNATNPDRNAWARLERSELTPEEFDAAFRTEALALGHDVPGSVVLGLLSGEIRPQMVAALDRLKDAGYLLACLTNNVVDLDDGHDPTGDVGGREANLGAIVARFDVVVESSKAGCRKPEPAFYELACSRLGVGPNECVFLDDLGINLKPAAAMGMRTIKVVDADQALTDLEALLGVPLR